MSSCRSPVASALHGSSTVPRTTFGRPWFRGYPCDVTAVELGRAGLQGWRGRVADAAGPLVAQRTPLSEDQVKAAIGVLFFVLSVVYVAKTLKEWIATT